MARRYKYTRKEAVASFKREEFLVSTGIYAVCEYSQAVLDTLKRVIEVLEEEVAK